jgi:hypothetical protein
MFMTIFVITCGIFYYQFLKPAQPKTIHQPFGVSIQLKDAPIKGEANMNG